MMTVQPVSLAADPLAARQMPASRRSASPSKYPERITSPARYRAPQRSEAQCTAVTYKASIYIYTCCARSRSPLHSVPSPWTCAPSASNLPTDQREYAKTAHLLLRMRQQRPSSLLALGPQTDQSTQCIILRVEVHRMQKVRDLLRQGRRREYPPTTRTAPALTSFRGPAHSIADRLCLWLLTSVPVSHSYLQQAQLMFCDGCDRGWHLYCLSPPLAKPPKGQWQCPTCEAGDTQPVRPSHPSSPHPAPMRASSSGRPKKPSNPDRSIDSLLLTPMHADAKLRSQSGTNFAVMSSLKNGLSTLPAPSSIWRLPRPGYPDRLAVATKRMRPISPCRSTATPARPPARPAARQEAASVAVHASQQLRRLPSTVQLDFQWRPSTCQQQQAYTRLRP